MNHKTKKTLDAALEFVRVKVEERIDTNIDGFVVLRVFVRNGGISEARVLNEFVVDCGKAQKNTCINQHKL